MLNVHSDAQTLIHSIVSGLWGYDDSEEEEILFEEDYEESFIDDDIEVGDGPGSDVDVAPLPLFERDEEDEEEVTEIDSPLVAQQRNRQAPIVISSDEEDDGEFADAEAH